MVRKELGELAWQRQLLLALVLQLVAAALPSSLLVRVSALNERALRNIKFGK